VFFLATTTDFAPKTFADFIAYAKQNPGKVRYASVGMGSNNHYDMEIFAKRAGIEMIHIPIKAGGAGMVNELVIGDAQIGLVNAASAGGMIKAGQLRPLAVVSDRRLAEHPDLPTLAEEGYPGVGSPLWAALFAPAGTPKPVLETLHKTAVQALNSPPVQENFKKQIIRAAPTASLEESKTWLAREMAEWSKVISEVKIELTE
jgi:tripartite-type tricarboxylate transporter receptor subunit TctC